MTTYRIQTEEDVATWRRSPGYAGFVAWIAKRSQRIIGKQILEGSDSRSEPIRKLMAVLDIMEQWVDEVPLLPESQRFGNRAFKTYIDIVEDRLPSLLPTPPELTARILPLLVSSHAFGHPIRLDYGSGHELSFVLSLWMMVKMGWVGGGRGHRGQDSLDGGGGEAGADSSEMDREEEEDELILRVYPRYVEDVRQARVEVNLADLYLTLVTHLQKKYRLEPAGSHGVWGLDDYCFLPYVFGSAQMLGMETSPSRSLENAKAAMTKQEDPSDMWTLSLKRVYEFKTGPFFEHSPLLHSLATTMPNFIKIHRGLLKMYEEEVLGKRVVVQHLYLDEITWGGEEVPSGGVGSDDPVRMMEELAVGEKKTALPSVTRAPWTMPPTRTEADAATSKATQASRGKDVDVGTKAPWALGGGQTRAEGGTGMVFDATRAPWAR